jgi:carbon monoxide dehydrogenase subunit G
MQLSDQRTINAAPETVWAAILNPDVLMACVPGCESMTGSPEAGYQAVVVQKVGPVSARFTGVVKLSDIVEGREVTISGEGKGGPAGFAKGSAKVTMTPEGAATLLTYEVNANVGGKLAQLGSRIIDGFAKKMADEFFNRFQQTIEGPAEPESVTPDGEKAPRTGWLGRMFGKDTKGGQE